MNETITNHVASGGIVSALYVIASALLAAYIAKKTDHFSLSFLILYWTLAQPVLNAFYKIKIPGIPFDFSPNRILLLILVPVLLKYILNPLPRTNYHVIHRPKFVPYLIAYILLVVVAMAVNRNVIPVKQLMAIPLEPVTFLVLFLAMKEIITTKMLDAVLKGIVYIAVINALVALYQVMVDPTFLLAGELRRAFGNTYRSYGLFPTEYILGSFQIMAVFVTLAVYRGKKIVLPLVALLVLSIFTTFHRLDMIVLIIVSIIYLRRYSQRRYGLPALLFIFFTAMAIIPAYKIFTSVGGESQIVKERLSADTVSGRFEQYKVIIKNLHHYPLGLGNYDTPAYQKLMITNRMTKSVIMPNGQQKVVGIGVHNGFLGVGIQYGILAMIAFTIMLFKMLAYFYKRADRRQPLTLIPFFSVLIWIMANSSNGIIVFRSYNVMIVALICGAFVGMYQKGLIVPKPK